MIIKDYGRGIKGRILIKGAMYLSLGPTTLELDMNLGEAGVFPDDGF